MTSRPKIVVRKGIKDGAGQVNDVVMEIWLPKAEAQRLEAHRDTLGDAIEDTVKEHLGAHCARVSKMVRL